MKKIAFITGASSGIGKDTALLMRNRGFVVYGAARRLDKLKDLEKSGINILELDVTIRESREKCINTIIEKEGTIDVLVNNAGYGSYGSLEDVPLEEAKQQFEVNIFGLSEITKLVLPYMRKMNSGRIINISSMGGKVTTPFGIWYHATKFALEGWSDCLRLEVSKFGIEVSVIEPGGIKTPWGTIAANNLRKVSKNGAYETEAFEVADSMERLYTGKSLTDSKVIAKAILNASTKKRPKTRYLLGYGAKISVFLRRLLSDRMYDKLIKKVM